MDARWARTWKPDESKSLGRRAQARLTIKGFTDPDLLDIESHSTTLTREGFMTVCSPCAAMDTSCSLGTRRRRYSPPTQMHLPGCCVQFAQHTIQCRLLQILSKTLASSVSFTEVLVVPSTTQLCHDCCVLRVVSSSSQDNLSLFSRETCIGEVDVPEFPAQRKSDQFVLVATVPLQTRLRLRPFRIQPQSRQRS